LLKALPWYSLNDYENTILLYEYAVLNSTMVFLFLDHGSTL